MGSTAEQETHYGARTAYRNASTKRVEGAKETTSWMASAGVLSPVSVARLLGRLGFVASQLFRSSCSACLWQK